MKWNFLLILSLTQLASCNPRTYFYKVIEKIGFIAYHTPLDSVGAGTLVKGKPANMMVYAEPQRCLPSTNPDGTPTYIKWEGKTDLPQVLRESKFDFSANLEFVGTNGNPLFKFKAGINAIKKVEMKFSDASVEFIDEIMFWKYYKTNMTSNCRKAFLKYPVFWKTLKVGKMEYVFRNEFGIAIELSAELVREMIDFSVGVNWNITNGYTLTIETPKYIGFLVAQVNQEAELYEDITLFSNKVNFKGNYVWKNATDKLLDLEILPVTEIYPL